MKFLIIFLLWLISAIPEYSQAELIPETYNLQYQTERRPGYNIDKDIRSIESFIRSANDKGFTTKVDVDHSRSWMRKTIKRGETIESLVIGITAGCKNFDEECRNIIKGMNRRDDDEIFSPNFQGDLTIPVEAITYKIQIFANDEHRAEITEKDGKQYLKQRVSVRFLNLLQSYVPNGNSLTSVPCLGKYPNHAGRYNDPFVSRLCLRIDFDVE